MPGHNHRKCCCAEVVKLTACPAYDVSISDLHLPAIGACTEGTDKEPSSVKVVSNSITLPLTFRIYTGGAGVAGIPGRIVDLGGSIAWRRYTDKTCSGTYSEYVASKLRFCLGGCTWDNDRATVSVWLAHSDSYSDWSHITRITWEHQYPSGANCPFGTGDETYDDGVPIIYDNGLRVRKLTLTVVPSAAPFTGLNVEAPVAAKWIDVFTTKAIMVNGICYTIGPKTGSATASILGETLGEVITGGVFDDLCQPCYEA